MRVLLLCTRRCRRGLQGAVGTRIKAQTCACRTLSRIVVPPAEPVVEGTADDLVHCTGTVRSVHGCSGRDRFDSWKEIANYLKTSVRTVQRWERTSLPVHRHATRDRTRCMPSKTRSTWRSDRDRLGTTAAPHLDRNRVPASGAGERLSPLPRPLAIATRAIPDSRRGTPDSAENIEASDAGGVAWYA